MAAKEHALCLLVLPSEAALCTSIIMVAKSLHLITTMQFSSSSTSFYSPFSKLFHTLTASLSMFSVTFQQFISLLHAIAVSRQQSLNMFIKKTLLRFSVLFHSFLSLLQLPKKSSCFLFASFIVLSSMYTKYSTIILTFKEFTSNCLPSLSVFLFCASLNNILLEHAGICCWWISPLANI